MNVDRQKALDNALAQVEKAFPPMDEDSARALANRQNAQLSTGPKTVAGKAASSKNALKHGLCATEHVTTATESPEEFAEFRAGLFEHYKPFGPIEAMLTDRLAVTIWRLRRPAILEALMMDVNSRGGTAPAWAFSGNCGGGRHLALSRYESSLERSMLRTLSELERLREQRAPTTADGMLNELIRQLGT